MVIQLALDKVRLSDWTDGYFTVKVEVIIVARN
jgi:hypothetical protein